MTDVQVTKGLVNELQEAGWVLVTQEEWRRIQRNTAQMQRRLNELERRAEELSGVSV